MTKTREEIISERGRLKREYGELYDDISALLFRYDPVGINFADNSDEYEPEVGTILPRLRTCHSPEDVRKVVHEEFVSWFDSANAGPEERYSMIASEIWERWKQIVKRFAQHPVQAHSTEVGVLMKSG